MKNLYIIFLLTTILSANPYWFFNIENNDKNVIIGYGEDTLLSNAKQNAIADVTQSISISVKSSVKISTSDIGGEANEDSSTNLDTKSEAILSGVEFIKIEKIGDRWYVAVKYDNSPIEIKLKKLLPNKIVDEKQNRYLKNTPLFEVLNNEIKKKLDYKIIRKDNLWQLKYKDILVVVDEKDFYKLFSNQDDNEIKIKANKTLYKQNDEMYFDIKHNNSGYISILYVEHNGKVGILTANKKSDKSFLYPDIKSEETFKISNPYNKTIRELYLALYSKTPLDLSQFENVGEDLLDDSNYAFDKLVSLLNNIEFSTFVVKIK